MRAQTPPNTGQIDFFVATGAPDSCGPGCSQWIAADGPIDQGSSQRLRNFLEQPEHRTLPVFFHSQGGLVFDGLRMGQILRDQRMTIGIGRTVIPGCATPRRTGSECDKRVKSGDPVPAQLEFDGARCHSACVFAFIGGTTRRIAPGARIGVHAPRTDEALWKKALEENPGLTRRTEAENHRNLWRAALTMGIDPELVNFAATIDHSKIHVLTRSEIDSFGIETRENFQSPWRENLDPSVTVRLFKAVNMGSTPKTADVRSAILGLSCVNPAGLLVTYQRKLWDDEKSGFALIVLRGANLNRRFTHPPGLPLGAWAVRVAYDELEYATRNGDIEIVERRPGDGGQLSFKLAPENIAPAISDLHRTCAGAAVPAPNSAGDTD